MSKQLSAGEFVDKIVFSPNYVVTWDIHEETGGAIVKEVGSNRSEKWTYDDLSGYWSRLEELPVGQLALFDYCDHEWRLYNSGLISFEFCEKCDVRKTN